MSSLLASFLFCSLNYAAAAEVCTTVADCAQVAVEAALQSKVQHRIAVPRGAVMAFNLQECPQGWTDFTPANGRMVLGAGEGNRDQNDRRLSQREVGESGGTETETLTVEQMPSHRHSGIVAYGGYSVEHHQSNARIPIQNHGAMGATGGNEPHNNMSPFVVLKFCERI